MVAAFHGGLQSGEGGRGSGNTSALQSGGKGLQRLAQRAVRGGCSGGGLREILLEGGKGRLGGGGIPLLKCGLNRFHILHQRVGGVLRRRGGGGRNAGDAHFLESVD